MLGRCGRCCWTVVGALENPQVSWGAALQGVGAQDVADGLRERAAIPLHAVGEQQWREVAASLLDGQRRQLIEQFDLHSQQWGHAQVEWLFADESAPQASGGAAQPAVEQSPMDLPTELSEPEQIDIDWAAGGQFGSDEPATVDALGLVMVGMGASPQSLGKLHERGFTAGTAVSAVPTEIWKEILKKMTPQDLAAVGQVNKFSTPWCTRAPSRWPMPSARRTGCMRTTPPS